SSCLGVLSVTTAILSGRVSRGLRWTLVCAGMLVSSRAVADTAFQVASGPWNVSTNWSSGVPNPATGVTTIGTGATVTYDASMGLSSFGGNEFHIGDGLNNASTPINTLNI